MVRKSDMSVQEEIMVSGKIDKILVLDNGMLACYCTYSHNEDKPLKNYLEIVTPGLYKEKVKKFHEAIDTINLPTVLNDIVFTYYDQHHTFFTKSKTEKPINPLFNAWFVPPKNEEQPIKPAVSENKKNCIIS